MSIYAIILLFINSKERNMYVNLDSGLKNTKKIVKYLDSLLEKAVLNSVCQLSHIITIANMDDRIT